ncbi:MAG: ABC transporter permease [Candidatus Babeliales bacterium]|nr:ABC transporter permease [Candidatus Babeliales bacterium]
MQKIKQIFSEEFSFFIIVPAFLWQIMFLWAPIIFILCLGFLSSDSTHFTADHYKAILNYTHLKVILRSLVTAVFNTFLCLLLAYPVSYYLVFRAKNWKNFLLFFLTLPLWVNFLIQVYSWFFLLEHHGLINQLLMFLGLINSPLHMVNNSFAILLVMLHVYLPFMIMPLYNALEKIDYSLIEASADLGASKWKTFARITWPLSIPGVYLGFFLVFVMSFGEVAIPMLLGGNKKLYVGNLISEYFLGAKNIHRGSAFTLLSGLSLALFLLALYYIINKKVLKKLRVH